MKGQFISILERYKELKPQGGNRLSPRQGLYLILEVKEHVTSKGFYIAKALWTEKHNGIFYERLTFTIQLNAFKLAVDNPKAFSPTRLINHVVRVTATRWTHIFYNSEYHKALVCDWVYDVTAICINRDPIPFLEMIGCYDDFSTPAQMGIAPSDEAVDTEFMDDPGDDGFYYGDDNGDDNSFEDDIDDDQPY